MRQPQDRWIYNAQSVDTSATPTTSTFAMRCPYQFAGSANLGKMLLFWRVAV
jgi:hypothetical protein